MVHATLNWSCKGLRIISGKKLGALKAARAFFGAVTNLAVTKQKSAPKTFQGTGRKDGLALATELKAAAVVLVLMNTKMTYCPVDGYGIAMDLLELKAIMKTTTSSSMNLMDIENYMRNTKIVNWLMAC